MKKGDGGRHLMTLHPNGGHSSADWLHEEGWLDFNILQSGHDYNRDNYNRLVQIKRKYDPDNLFHLNQNIRPA